MGEVKETQMTGAPSREAKVCTEPRSPYETMVVTNADNDTTEKLVVEDGDRVLEVVERRWEGIRRFRIGTLGVNCWDLQLYMLQIQSRDRVVLGFRRLSKGEPTLSYQVSKTDRQWGCPAHTGV
jgi:hypothetical protein